MGNWKKGSWRMTAERQKCPVVRELIPRINLAEARSPMPVNQMMKSHIGGGERERGRESVKKKKGGPRKSVNLSTRYLFC